MKCGPVHPGPIDLATGASLPEITEVQRLTLNPGDSLVIRLPGVASLKEADEIAWRVRHVLGLDGGTPVLVLPDDGSIEILEPGSPA